MALILALTMSTIVSISPVLAVESLEGKIVKLAGESTLYYIGVDGKRYVFPNHKTFSSWFTDFADVVEVTADQLDDYQLAGNVRYRPGVFLVKIDTDPKVYAVTKNGVLRWIKTEELAKKFYGEFWHTFIDDISPAFFVNYKTGDNIEDDDDFNPDTESTTTETIDDDHEVGKKLGLDRRGKKANSHRQEKVAVCHLAGTTKHQTLVIAKSALEAHLAHGDTEGYCGSNPNPEIDTKAPIMSHIQVQTSTSTSSTTAAITWTTNELSTSEIKYATSSLVTTSSTSSLIDSTKVLSHTINLFGLTSSTTYYFILTSKDVAGNAATSTEQHFSI